MHYLEPCRHPGHVLAAGHEGQLPDPPRPVPSDDPRREPGRGTAVEVDQFLLGLVNADHQTAGRSLGFGGTYHDDYGS